MFMAKRRQNPNWGKPEPIGPIIPTVTEFEQVVREYKLSPDQYLRSTRLREWARRNKNSKYIPEPLLEAWGFEIESTLSKIGSVNQEGSQLTDLFSLSHRPEGHDADFVLQKAYSILLISQL